MRASERRKRNQATARRLREEGLSVRQIAERMDAAKSTVDDWLKAPVPNAPVAAAGPRNQRAVTHGATSEQRLVPLRQEKALYLRRLFPDLDEIRLATLADRLARLESARAWLDQQAGVVRNDQGDVYPIVREVEKWATGVERMLADLEEEARKRKHDPPDLNAVLAEIAAGDDPEPEADAPDA